MNKFAISAAAAALFSCASMAAAGTVTVLDNFESDFVATGSVDVVENFSNGFGSYVVSNNTNGRLYGLGVSNRNTSAGINRLDDNQNTLYSAGGENNWYYGAATVRAEDWGDVIPGYFAVERLNHDGLPEYVELSFQDAFGDFSDVVGDDNVFHWYYALDGEMDAGDVSNGLFAFAGAQPASNIIGITGRDLDGLSAFTAGSATLPGTGGGTSAVPLPASAWLLLVGVGGLAARARRKA